ncbi:complement factor B-like isoform X2 [Styela clava]
MILGYNLILVVILFIQQNVQGQICSEFSEFKCFWDGACIPNELKCDGRFDCANGEDETEWFAECTNCSAIGKFHCHKESGQVCISRDYMCDDYSDCLHDEDESYEFAKCPKKCKANLEKAALVGRPACRKKCRINKDCKKKCKKGQDCSKIEKKKCVCDHECGMSCVAILRTCPPLEMIPNLRHIRYVRRSRHTNKLEDAVGPYKYDVRAYHTCEPGYLAVPSNVRFCHGRARGENKTWTKEILCTRSCPMKEEDKIKEYELSCGLDCITDGDCAAGKTCQCDDPCGRTCVDLKIECGDAPPAENSFIEYTGEGFERVAHYICNEGTYTAAGDVSRKCTGSGKWGGKLIQCKRVTCQDPVPAISKMGGRVLNYEHTTAYYYNATLMFACGSDQRLLGSEIRTCMGDGKWSGVNTVCDNIGNLERCPHPGIPIGGYMKGFAGDYDFVVGAKVEFSCQDGLVLVGERKQKCLFVKEWSGDGAPDCVDPKYSDLPTDVINKLSQSTSNIRQTEKFSSSGRTIKLNSRGRIEVYFVIDLSLSVGPGALRNTMGFAKSLVKRLSQNDTTGRVNYGIIVFATKPMIKLNINNEPRKTAEEVITLLNEIEKDRENIKKTIMQGTDIQSAIELLDEQMIAFSYENDKDMIIKRHCLVLTDGAKNAGGSPSKARKIIEIKYAYNPPEESSSEVREELQQIASKHENFIYVEDFYKLHKYVNQITDVEEDYNSCGQAGYVGSVRNLSPGGRILGGERAAERAWPWQALITSYNKILLDAFDQVMGGGSLINSKWVLSAAHVFEAYSGLNWEQGIMVSLGITRRPNRYNILEASVKMFQPEQIYIHDKYADYNGKYLPGSYQNDIALIKLGGEFVLSKDGKRMLMPDSLPGYVEFTPFIRPVCLPCSPDSCVSQVLMKKDSRGKVLIKGEETDEEKCKIEYDVLMGKNSDSVVAVVATGFGYNATRKDEDYGFGLKATRELQQALLNVTKREECARAVKLITRRKNISGFKHIFTDQMFCAVGGGENGGKIIDTCKGDSGGPIVREIRDDFTKESCFVQVGIVSWGYGCGQQTKINQKNYFYPGFYTDVTSLMSWVTNTMEDHDKKKSD